MITHLHIKDFAIIENVDVDFYEGLNIITGETGAGKSIAVQALSLALGARADSSFVRSGCDKALVQLAAEIGGEEYILSREISSQGRNLCKINGELSTLSELSGLTERLADIHGQYDHQSLLDPENHINFVDSYGSERLSPLLSEVRRDYAEYRKAYLKLSNFLTESREGAKRKDLMEYELSEIKSSRLTLDEDVKISERLSILQNSEKLSDSLSEALNALSSESGSALESAGNAMRALHNISGISKELDSLGTELSDIYYRVEDAARLIRSKLDGISFSRGELDELLRRQKEIDELKKKYGREDASIENVLAYSEKLEESLSAIENSDEYKLKLTRDFQTAEKKLSASAKMLSDKRKEIGKELCEKIEKELSELSFSSASISLKSEYSLTPKGHFSYSENGIDRMEFMLSTNLGEPEKPLSKIASGGEMSRIMLAFKRIIADYDNIPTMIFDEIDSGISGTAANVVGEKLLKIAEKHQVICITHLPQIAARGRHNFKIEKTEGSERTYTSIKELSADEKTAEVARLIGGLEITPLTLASARELIGS